MHLAGACNVGPADRGCVPNGDCGYFLSVPCLVITVSVPVYSTLFSKRNVSKVRGEGEFFAQNW